MINKLNAAADKMFPVTYEVKTATVTEINRNRTNNRKTVTYTEMYDSPI